MSRTHRPAPDCAASHCGETKGSAMGDGIGLCAGFFNRANSFERTPDAPPANGPHPEERRRRRRVSKDDHKEGPLLFAILRDAALRAAPEDEAQTLTTPEQNYAGIRSAAAGTARTSRPVRARATVTRPSPVGWKNTL